MSDSVRPPRSGVIGTVVAVAGLLLVLFGHAIYITRAFTQVEESAKALAPRLALIEGEMTQMRLARESEIRADAEQRAMLKAIADDVGEIRSEKRKGR